METIEIDGSYGEAGGAILRLACSLSATTSKPVRVYNIRASRPKPGLRVQHLEGIKAIASACNGTLSGAALWSKEIEFHPGKIRAEDITVPISTAGSLALVFQSLKLLPLSIESGMKILIKGGATFGKFAPPLVYTKYILLPVLEKMGYSCTIDIRRHGFYPAGGAEAEIGLTPCKTLKPLFSEPLGSLVNIRIFSIADGRLKSAMVAERQAKAAGKMLAGICQKMESEIEYADTLCPGSGIVIEARDDSGNILGSDSIGESGVKAEAVGEAAAKKLLRLIESNVNVDEHLSDQLLPFMALAHGESRIISPVITDHAKTNIWVIEKFVNASFGIMQLGKAFEIYCSGMQE